MVRFAGARLREEREKRRLSQAQLGRLIGSTAKDPGKNVSRWERGEVEPEGYHVAALTDVLRLRAARSLFVDDALG